MGWEKRQVHRDEAALGAAHPQERFRKPRAELSLLELCRGQEKVERKLKRLLGIKPDNYKIIRSATLGDACQSKNLQVSVPVRTYWNMDLSFCSCS